MRRASVVPYLIAAAIALTSILGVVARPATGAPSERVSYVIVAGAAGLRWDDVNPTDTPNLWRLALQGSIGALSVRSATTPTCPADGWLTLGAGSYARRTAGPVVDECPPMAVDIERPDSQGANLPDQEFGVADLNRDLTYRTQPGALAEAVRCTVAVGPGAAVAAARPYGRVDRYEPSLPAKPESLLSSCVLSIVDLGTVDGDDPAVRRADAQQVDQHLAALMDGRPSSSLLLVAGLSDTDRTSRLHVAIADGPGYRGGYLTSSSTGRHGYVQLTDLAPTALAALGKQAPEKLFTGAPVDSVTGRPTAVAAAVAHFSDADREASEQRRVAGWFFTAVTLFELALFVAAVPLLRRARRMPDDQEQPAQRDPPGDPVRLARLINAAEVLLVAAAVTVPGALIADAVPWWRSTAPGPIFAVVTVGMIALLTAIVVLGPWRRGALGPLGAVGGLAAGIVGVDVLTGAHLQLNGVAGYSAVEGGRYAGLGTIGLGLFIAGVLLMSGGLAQRLSRRWRPVVVAFLGGVGVVLVGSPYLGSEAAGAIALTAGVCVAAAIAAGGFLTFARLAWATLTGLAVTLGFALLDLRRPVEDRGSLGRFVSAFQDGTAGNLLHRISVTNVTVLVTSPLTLVVLGSAVLVMFVLLRPWGGLKRLFGIFPAVRAALTGTAVAAILAGLLDGVGFNVAGAAAAVAVPLAVVSTLRVLAHAEDRTGRAPAIAEPAVALGLTASPGPAGSPSPAGPPASNGSSASGSGPAGEPQPSDEPDDSADTDRPAELPADAGRPADLSRADRSGEPDRAAGSDRPGGSDRPAASPATAADAGDVLL